MKCVGRVFLRPSPTESPRIQLAQSRTRGCIIGGCPEWPEESTALIGRREFDGALPLTLNQLTLELISQFPIHFKGGFPSFPFKPEQSSAD